MYRDKTIGVVVPAYNEETQIAGTVETMPDYVDRIVVIDDMSTDGTAEIVVRLAEDDPRVTLIRHSENGGVGRAISSGYIWCRDNHVDIAVVMAGDGQMDPADMPGLLDPVIEDRADYAKGNRLITGEAWKNIPRVRYLGNSALTLMTKVASGYWHVTDSQTGYTALNRKGLELLPLEDIYPRYGMPNDFLVTCNIYNMRVMDVPIKPVYNVGEKSGIRISQVMFSLPLLLLRLFCRRMVQKYIIRDFHPLIFFYSLGFLLMLVDIPLIIRLILVWSSQGYAPPMTSLAILFCTIMSTQSLLFAMLFDMEANRELKGS
ncbi:MAG: glycosyltransferase family 2 protein [Candidatus Fermentibacteraceae bacterium]|nr:glycosyltransferase family 2 protein [Candidatus Fermentibacteraceae bacterium]